jgi:Peptidase family C25
VAVWAPASLGFASEHRLLMVELYKAIFQGGQSGLGAATTTAKLAAYSQNSFLGESVKTYVLFGDPATQLDLAPAPTAQRAFR